MTEKFRILDNRAQAREKLSIWYGSRDNYYHGVKEMIANAADELRNNPQENPEITVILASNNKNIIVKDNGRGIRIGDETDGIPNYKVAFEILFGGTKYDVTQSVTTGTNGVGTTVLNYTSEIFEVRSFYDGKNHSIRYKDGGILTERGFTEEVLPESMKDYHGSEFSVILDPKIYTNTIFTVEKIRDIIKHFAVATTGVKFTFYYEDEDLNEFEEVYKYDSIMQYFEEIVGNTTTSGIFTLGEIEYVNEVVLVENGITVDEQNLYNLLLTTTPESEQETYLNMTYLEEGGSINDGILDGVRLFMNKYCRENKLFPPKVTTFSKEDISSSITALAFVESNIVEYSNQTKMSTKKVTYKDQIKDYTDNLLKAMSAQKPVEFKKMVDHLLVVQKANGVNDKARQKLKKKLTEKVEGIGNKVEKLIDCEVHGIEAELFLTEGDSANGSIIDSRDDHFQAAFPLRGKVLNVLKASVGRAFKNEEIINMVKIIGTGINDGKKEEFDITKSRYGKIVITTDADADGGHIASLLITFLYRFMRPLITEGYVYLAQTPLYELKFQDDSVVYFLTENEKNQNIGKYEGKKYIVNRLKGLGEMDPETMYETTMNPETRNIIKVNITTAEAMSKMIEDWMGEEVAERKTMITKQLPKYVNLID